MLLHVVILQKACTCISKFFFANLIYRVYRSCKICSLRVLKKVVRVRYVASFCMPFNTTGLKSCNFKKYFEALLQEKVRATVVHSCSVLFLCAIVGAIF